MCVVRKVTIRSTNVFVLTPVHKLKTNTENTIFVPLLAFTTSTLGSSRVFSRGLAVTGTGSVTGSVCKTQTRFRIKLGAVFIIPSKHHVSVTPCYNHTT